MTDTTETPMSLDDAIDRHFAEPAENATPEPTKTAPAETPEPPSAPRDDKGRFTSPQPEADATPPAPEGETAAEARRRVLAFKAAGEDRTFDFDDPRWATDEGKAELTDLLEKAYGIDAAKETAERRGQAAAAKELQQKLLRKGYQLGWDEQAQDVVIVPIPKEAPKSEPEKPDPEAVEEARIEELERIIEQTANSRAVVELSRLMRKRDSRTRDMLRQDKESREQASREREEKRRVDEFNRRIDGLIEDSLKGLAGDERAELAHLAWNAAVGRAGTAKTVEEVEATVRGFFRRVRPSGTQAPAATTKTSTAMPAAKAPLPVGSGAATGLNTKPNPLSEAKSLDDLDWDSVEIRLH